jgi:[ribosomal protein S5]-alanine N-acetyltransferase
MQAIETERLILRNFRKRDAEPLFAYLHEPVASCFLSLKLEDLAAAEKMARNRRRHDNEIAVCLKDTDRLIGDLFLMPEGDTFSVGWNFNPAFGKKGYAFEAASALFNYLFNERNARRIYAYVEDDNLPSQRLCKRLSMRQEGLFKEFISFRKDANGNPVYENTMQFALLRKEWEGSQPLSHLAGCQTP